MSSFGPPYDIKYGPEIVGLTITTICSPFNVKYFTMPFSEYIYFFGILINSFKNNMFNEAK